MITLQQRLLAHWDYKIAEHARAAADHNIKVQMYRDVKDFTERAIEDQEPAAHLLRTAALDVIESCDLSCLRVSEQISAAEGCPCPVCLLRRLALSADVGAK